MRFRGLPISAACNQFSLRSGQISRRWSTIGVFCPLMIETIRALRLPKLRSRRQWQVIECWRHSEDQERNSELSAISLCRSSDIRRPASRDRRDYLTRLALPSRNDAEYPEVVAGHWARGISATCGERVGSWHRPAITAWLSDSSYSQKSFRSFFSSQALRGNPNKRFAKTLNGRQVLLCCRFRYFGLQFAFI